MIIMVIIMMIMIIIMMIMILIMIVIMRTRSPPGCVGAVRGRAGASGAQGQADHL